MTTPSNQSPSKQAAPASIGTPEPDKRASVEEIESDIAHTRQQLGDTVEALTAKLDVKSQARRQLDDTKVKVRGTVRDAKVQASNGIQRLRAVTLADPTAQQGPASNAALTRYLIPAAAGIAVAAAVVAVIRRRA